MLACHPILRLFLQLVALSSHVAPFVGKRSKCGGQEWVSGFVGLVFALCRFCEHFLWAFHERVSWSSFFFQGPRFIATLTLEHMKGATHFRVQHAGQEGARWADRF